VIFFKILFGHRGVLTFKRHPLLTALGKCEQHLESLERRFGFVSTRGLTQHNITYHIRIFAKWQDCTVLTYTMKHPGHRCPLLWSSLSS